MRLRMGWAVLAVMSAAMMWGQEARPAAKPAASSADANADGQTDAGARTITVIPDPVHLAVVVRDKKGALVQGLTKSDFVLQVGNKPQTIQSIEQDKDLPMTLGLLVDVSGSQRDRVEQERAASKAFLQAVLTPASGKRAADKVFVVQFAKQIELLQDVTEDRSLIDKALQELGTESPTFHVKEEADTTDAEGRKVHHGGTSLYDALFLSADEVMAKQKGRKVLVVLTDGVDVGSKNSLTETIEAAQEANTVVYTIYFRPAQKFDQGMANRRNYPGGGYPGGGYPGGGYPGGGYPGGRYPGGGYPGGGYPGGGPGGNTPNGNGNPNGRGPGGGSRKPSVDGKQVLDRTCGETGGRVFEVGKRLTVEESFAGIAEELKAAYRIGFTPDAAAARFGFHPIDLNLANADLNKKDDLQTRSGYYGGETH